MSESKLSVLGIYKFYKLRDIDIFNQLVLPEGIDKETLINNILLKSADFECIYPDGKFLPDAIGLWSKKWNRTFTKWIEALNIDYNPLENYDRMESWDDAGTMKGKLSGTETSYGLNTNSRSSFDSAYLQPYDQDSANNQTTTGSDADQTTTNKKTGRAHGNIGVTTSQQMLESELNISKWNIYEHITDIFLQEFCILVY